MRQYNLARRFGMGGQRGAHGRRERQQGAEVVALALTLVVFLMLIFSGAEIARLLYAYNATGHLAHEAVRYAVVRGSLAAADGRTPASSSTISDFVNGLGVISPITVTACWSGTLGTACDCTSNSPAVNSGVNNKPGMPVRVCVTARFQPLVLPKLLWFGPATLTSRAEGTILY